MRNPPLWAVRIQGSDSLVAQPTREDADLFKKVLDRLDREYAERPQRPMFRAEVVPWLGTRDEHAEALRREAEEN